MKQASVRKYVKCVFHLLKKMFNILVISDRYYSQRTLKLIICAYIILYDMIIRAVNFIVTPPMTYETRMGARTVHDFFVLLQTGGLCWWHPYSLHACIMRVPGLSQELMRKERCISWPIETSRLAVTTCALRAGQQSRGQATGRPRAGHFCDALLFNCGVTPCTVGKKEECGLALRIGVVLTVFNFLAVMTL
jgi:hypothetical protein